MTETRSIARIDRRYPTSRGVAEATIARPPAEPAPAARRITGPNGETIYVIGVPTTAPSRPERRWRDPDWPWVAAALALVLAVGALAFLSVLGAGSSIAVVGAAWAFILGGLLTGFGLLFILGRLVH